MHRYGGISRYFVELLKRLPNFGVTPRLVVPISFNEYLAATPQIYRGFSSSRLHIRGAVRLTTLASRCSDHLIPKLVSHDFGSPYVLCSQGNQSNARRLHDSRHDT